MGKYSDKMEKVLPLIQKGIQNLSALEALEIKAAYPSWEKLVKQGEIIYDKPGFKFTYNNNGILELYECVNANPTFQTDWKPGLNTMSLYLRINEENAGSTNDPITAARGMKYIVGQYYLDPEDNMIYCCKRLGMEDGESIELAYLPHELVGMYFTKE